MNKKISILITAVLMLGLVACTNNASESAKKNNASSTSTTLSSEAYSQTHTQMVQNGMNQYLPINPWAQGQLPQTNYGQAPVQQQVPAQRPVQQPTQTQNTGNTQFTQQVVELTNAQRRQSGLPDLQIDSQLSGVAQKKSEDMQQNQYFSHTSPTYGSPFEMMTNFGITFNSAGENIAQGQQTPEEVVQAWMNSEGHKENIMNNTYTHIGVGYVQNGNYWTQMFIAR